MIHPDQWDCDLRVVWVKLIYCFRNHHTEYGQGIPLCRVDFTQHHFYGDAKHVNLVFIMNQEACASLWAFSEWEHNGIYLCVQINSAYMHVTWYSQNSHYGDPNTVYQNFKQDC